MTQPFPHESIPSTVKVVNWPHGRAKINASIMFAQINATIGAEPKEFTLKEPNR
jgi:hypothetical protein